MMSLRFKFAVKDIISDGKTTQENINAIKEWNNTLPNNIPILPDELVTLFLLSCSNNIEQTKKTIITYYKAKALCPAIFDNRNVDSEDFELTCNTAAYAPVFWPEKNTYIIYNKLMDTNYRNCYVDNQLKVATMTIDSFQWKSPPDSIIIVQDIKGIGLMHLTRLKLDSLKTFLLYVQQGMPMKLEAIHYVNSNYVLNKFMVIAKMFIDPDLYNKIHFHSGIDNLDKFIPKHCIPSDFNGDQQSIEVIHRSNVKRLQEMKKFWIEEEYMRKQCDNRVIQ